MQKRLMVVEDNPDLLTIYQQYFRGNGFDVVGAHDGEDALKKCLEFQPQLILCDIKMPNLTGFDVIEIMNSYPKLKEKSRIFIMSAYGDEAMLKRAEQLGIKRQQYLVKSQVSLSQVLQIVRQHFQSQPAS